MNEEIIRMFHWAITLVTSSLLRDEITGSCEKFPLIWQLKDEEIYSLSERGDKGFLDCSLKLEKAKELFIVADPFAKFNSAW